MSLSTEGFTRLGTLKVPSLGVGVTSSNTPLSIKAADLTTAMANSLKADWGDLRISTDLAGNNQLPLDIVDGGSIAWTRLTSVAADDVIYIWGNKPAAVKEIDSAAYGRNAVWVDEVSRYHLSTGTGNAIDSKGVENGVLVGGTTTQAAAVAAFGNSTFFNDAPYYTRSDPFAGVSTFGAAIWHNLRVTTPTHGLLASWESSTGNADMSVLWWATGAGKINLRAKNTMGTVATAIGATVLAVGQDYHLAIRYDGATLKTYIDGVQDASIAFTGTIDTSTIPFNIMSYDTLGTNPFDGYSQELAIGDRTPSQISIEYDNQSATGSWWIAADAGGAISVTESLTALTIDSFNPSIDFTGVVSVTESPTNLNLNSFNPTIGLTATLTVTESLTNLEFNSLNPVVTLTPPNTIIVTEATTSLTIDSFDPTITFSGTISVTESLTNLDFRSYRPAILVGEKDYSNIFYGVASQQVTFTGTSVSSTFSGTIKQAPDFSGIIKTSTFSGVSK